MSTTQGKLFVIDGIDGTGKATQTKLLVERLRKEGRQVETLDFPQYEANICGRILKQSLKGAFGDYLALDPKSAAAIYAADRRESLPKLRGWLQDGKIVILDRYVSSSMIHQGAKFTDEGEAKAFLEWMDQLEFGMMELPRPDAIIYLDVSAEIAQRLLRERAVKEGGERDAIESEIDHMIASRNRALRITESLSSWKRIDCSDGEGGIKKIEPIHEDVYAAIVSHL